VRYVIEASDVDCIEVAETIVVAVTKRFNAAATAKLMVDDMVTELIIRQHPRAVAPRISGNPGIALDAGVVS